jgi:DNA helicase HerA-like ATPase
MLGILSFMVVYHFLTRRFLNPYKLIMVFGKKGSGKSTLLTKLALQYQKQGIPVFSTEKIPGCYLIDYKDVGYVEFPPNSVLLIDEVGMIWDNRNFKNFDTKVRDWFKLQRHRKVTVYLFSQTFDVDKKIRDLTDEMYLVEKKFRVFSYAKRIVKRTVLNKASAEAPSKIDENLEFDSLLLFWCGSRRFTFIPKYAKYFDSFVADKLLEKEFEQVPLLCPVKQRPRLRLPSFPKRKG